VLPDKAFWVEILSRHGDVAQRHRIDGDEVRLGRAYDNQIILDDPYVAAHHVRIARDPAGMLVADDLGSINGLFEGDSNKSMRHIVLGDDQSIRVGTTRIRVRDAGHTVSAERRFARQTWAWHVVFALSVTIIVVRVVLTWLTQMGDPKIADYAGPLAGIGAAVLTWAGMWSVLGRIFAGAPRFRRNLLVALSGLLTLLIVRELADYGAFSFSLQQLTAYRYVGVWLVLGAFTFIHLMVISTAHLRLKASAVALIVGIAIATFTVLDAGERANSDRQRFVRALKPPFLRLVMPETESTFFARAADLQKALDRSRSQQPPEEDDSDSGDED
jgi:hypothetical protein